MTAIVEEQPHGAPPETILFVEDEIFVRLDMAEFLRQCGYRVAESVSVTEAIEALKAKLAIDLVITDIRLSGAADGRELARWVGENRPGVRVLLTSAFRKEDGDIEGVTYLTKPYTGRALLDCVKNLLGEPPASAG